ncbi:MAG: mannitol dehydrogenase family protein [Clostridia bacterium]|nr:mannitol dehydrogenase family protein [Clostridia bacterium]
MKLTLKGLSDGAFARAGWVVPSYDIQAMRQKTWSSPDWLHFGAGNLLRAFPAAALCDMLSAGCADKGLIVAESHDGQIIDAVFHPCEELSLLVTFLSGGGISKRIIASVAASLRAEPEHADWPQLVRCFMSPGLRLVSLTITEKGYDASDVSFDAPVNAMSRLAKLLYERYRRCAAPLALVSMDNLTDNGDKLKESVTSIAERWVRDGKADIGFLAYLTHPETLSYPLTMIDKITPAPDETVSGNLAALGFEDMGIIRTRMGTVTAPFVNAEETGYLVIEDNFPNGRPAFEKAGFFMTDRETVRLAEKMKVGACLNPIHTALALFGCLLGYDRIHAEMADADLRAFVTQMAFNEMLPAVTPPSILNPAAFLDEVLNKRLPNPYIPDSPRRIATDTSQKIPARFGGTLKAYQSQERLDAGTLRCIPVVLAGWLRYLSGLRDDLTPFELSPDPMADWLSSRASAGDYRGILMNERLFGVHLEEMGLMDIIMENLRKMSAAGGVRRAIREALTASD